MFIDYKNYDAEIELLNFEEIKNTFNLSDKNIADIIGVDYADIHEFKAKKFISEEIFMKLGILHEFSKATVYQKLANVLQGVNIQLGIPYDCIAKLSGLNEKKIEAISKFEIDSMDDKDFLKTAVSLILILSLHHASPTAYPK